MKKAMILTLLLMTLTMSPAYADPYAQDCPNCVYALYEGTTQTLVSGNVTTYVKITFLINKATGDVWAYNAEGSRWVLTNREKIASAA